MIDVGDTLPPLQKTAEVLYVQVEGEQFSVKSTVLLLWWTQLLAKDG